MDQLVKIRATIKGKLTRFQNHLNALQALYDDPNQKISSKQNLELQSRHDNASGYLAEYEAIHGQIVEVTNDLGSEEQQFSDFESMFFSAIGQAKDLIEKSILAKSPTLSRRSSPTGSVASLNSTASQHSPALGLPKINIPKFSGDIENWTEFKNIFTSLIHENGGLNDIQRFHYLKGCLSGAAAEVIKSIEFSASNYQIVYKALIARYDQPKLLIRKHLKSILELEPLTKESASNLRKVNDSLFKHVTALQALATTEQLFETFIIHVISGKLDQTTSRQWETLRNKSKSDLPTLDEFKSFLTNQANLLDSLDSKTVKVVSEKPRFQSKSFVANSPTCSLCKGDHSIARCEIFLKLSPKDRSSRARELKVCFNCLSRGHMLPQCPSKYTCRTCKAKHHSLLHFESDAPVAQPGAASSTPQLPVATPESSVSAFCSNAVKVLLPTANCKILDSCGNPVIVRVLLDSGSQSNFVRSDLCVKLGLPIQAANISVSGLNRSLSHIRSSCNLELMAQHSPYKIKLSCLILEEITGTLPSFQVDCSQFKIPGNVRLSDPFYDQPRQIDLLIGSSAFFEILCIGQVRLGPNLPILQKTCFGWVVSGPIGTSLRSQVHCHLSIAEVPDQLARFWELENYPSDRIFSSEENACESHFKENTRRDPAGRFIVSIPFKQPPQVLGDSFTVAQKRFLSLERRLESNPDLSDRYSSFMKEYLDLGHMSPSSDSASVSYYLPHHGVLKEDSLTTKLRVVFNGSQVTTAGPSLNSIQMVGPSIQQDLFFILVRFRKYLYAISSDVEKMYRQVQIEPDQRPLQRILWRFSPTDPILSYDLNTVTYGTASASFLAIRSLFQLGIDCETSQPEISRIIKQDFYVDDLLSGADSIESAREICSQLDNVLNSGCFKLRKWISNDPTVLSSIPESDLHPGVHNFGAHERTNTLGLLWSFPTDHLMYLISKPTSNNAPITKRTILSEASQIFDPLGLLSPCTIGANILLQQLWLEKISWDDPVPNNIQSTWTTYRRELTSLNDIKIPRHVLCPNPIDIQMHGFCDASIQGYGACIYLRSMSSDGQVQVRLLCSKTRVGPLNPITIPKLELSGALLLAKLSVQVLKALDAPISRCFLWSDSTIVLGWLKTSPNLLKTFVCNRVADIQRLTSDAVWRHVPTKSNPADLLSRGTTPQTLKASSLWWHAPSCLAEDESSWPNSISCSAELPELKRQSQCLLVAESSFPLSDFSSLTRLERVLSYCFRFSQNCSSPKEERLLGPLSPKEIDKSLMSIIKIAQAESFVEELKLLSQSKALKSTSPLLGFNPFLDPYGILRVGGRLRNSQFAFDKKHPMLLSGKHPISRLIVEREHSRLLHAGAQLVLSSLRDRFWITSGRNLTKQVIHCCVRCFRLSPKLTQPIMGNLPSSRVEISHPFTVVGVDYAGPLTIKDRKGRGSKLSKAYICLYVCFMTKAVHLELVTDLSTESFILSFRRFVSRRGRPVNVYSDNGSNFVGANSELRELGRFLKMQEKIIPGIVACEGINWHFAPAHSPHFGGLWEAGVKSCKHHLKRVVGNCILTYEELCTLLYQIEAILNSRPLCPLTSDPNDLQPLTPAHFLVGRPLIALPDPDVTEISDSRLTIFQRVQQIQQHLWQRWSKEYIFELQQRQKWKTHQSELKLGALVLIKDDHLPPLRWKLGRITQLHPGSDGINRVASVFTNSGAVRRSFSKLCPLPIEA